jgi:hypothetical protein
MPPHLAAPALESISTGTGHIPPGAKVQVLQHLHALKTTRARAQRLSQKQRLLRPSSLVVNQLVLVLQDMFVSLFIAFFIFVNDKTYSLIGIVCYFIRCENVQVLKHTQHTLS